MSQRFNLTAQLQLQAPRNVGQVVNQIRNQLSGITANVQVTSNTRNLAVVNRQLQGVRDNAGAAGRNVGVLNRNLAEAARRFSVITVATGTMLALARSIKDGVGEAILFERELVKISQVTGKSVNQLRGLTKEVTRLSTSLGASSSDLLNVSRVLAQAGFAADKTKQALDILAKTSLAATFDSIQDTTEGAIAVLRQFRTEARQAGGDVKFLEQTMDAINSVSKKFAVESGDLITVIRRTGGVFEAAGGSVNELIALFTSVRATTRESAETISTGLRTIFTRIQRTDTVNQLKSLGIELRNAEGQFVGAFEAFRRLSVGLSALDPKDWRFSEIVESLGGFRQIGKVIPLIRQFQTAQEALNVAQASSGSVARDAATAQQSLYQQAQKVGQEFKALMRTFADSGTFRSIATGALELAKAFIRIADALEPLLPMITLLAGMKIGQAVGPMLGGLMGGRGRGAGMRGGISRFASGGYVPGSGNRDTVPAMLTPGEFVIKKSSARKLGPATLSAMNNNRYANGRTVKKLSNKEQAAAQKTGAFGRFMAGQQGSAGIGTAQSLGAAKNAILKQFDFTPGDGALDIAGAFLKPVGIKKKLRGLLSGQQVYKAASKGLVGTKKGAVAAAQKAGFGATSSMSGLDIPINISSGSVPSDKRSNFQARLAVAIGEFSKKWVKQLGTGINFSRSRFRAGYSKANRSQIEGNIFEAAIESANFMGEKSSGDARIAANSTWDFPKGLSGPLAAMFGIPPKTLTDTKRTFNLDALQSLMKKATVTILESARKNIAVNSLLTQGSRNKEVGLAALGLNRDAKKADIQNAIAKQSTRHQAKFNKAFGYNSGGQVDNVPALLTPGEFVINKKSAQSIGYNNLHGMNRSGVAKFAWGGMVGLAGGKKSGAASFRGLGAAGVSQFEMENKAAAQQMATYTRSIGQAQAAMIAYSRAIVASKSEDEALERARNSAARALQEEARMTDRLSDATEREIQELDRSQPGQQQQPGLIGRGLGAVNTSLNQLQPVMDAAQSFVFAGAMAGSLAAQFSGLDKVTKQIITEFSGFMATFIGLGATVTQVLTSLIQTATASSVANTIETRSSLAAAAADDTEAVSGASVVAAMTPLTAVLLLLGIATTAVVAHYKFLEIRARALADSFKEAGEKILEAVEKGTGTGAGLPEQRIQELRMRQEEQAAQSWWDNVGDVFAQGITMGGPLEPKRKNAQELFEERLEKIRRESRPFEDALRNSIKMLVGMTGELRRFKDELSDIDKAQLEPEEEIQRRQENLRLDRFSGIQEALRERAVMAKDQEVLPSALSEDMFKDQPLKLMRFQTITKVINKATEGLEEQEKAARDTLQKTLELPDVKSGKFSHEDLMASNAAYKTSVEQSTAAIKANHDAIILSLQAELNAAKIKLVDSKRNVGHDKDAANKLKAAQENYDTANRALIAAMGRGRLATEDNANAIEKTIQGYQDMRDANIRAAAAATELRKRLETISQFARTMKSLEMGLNSMERSIGDMDAMINNTTTSFKSLDFGLGDLSSIPSMKRFEKNITALADQFNVPEGMKNDLLSMAKLQGGGRKSILEKFGKERKKGEAAPTVQQILEAGGVGEVWDRLGKHTKTKMEEAIDIGIGGGLTDDMLDKILKPFFDDETMKKTHGTFQGLQKLFDREVQLEEKRLAKLEKLADMQIEANKKVIDAEIRGAEAMAEAMGIELSTAQKEAARRRQAQTSLTGTNLTAGDAAGAGALIRFNQAELKRVRAEQASWSNFGKRNIQKRLAAEEQKLVTSTKKATAELERLADQSELLADIESDIAKEREKREAISDIFEDFAFGGFKERSDILRGIGGIRQAMATGTVQNQSQAQRGLTRQMLDALSDVPIGPGGETGEQIKKWLAANDMVRFGLISRQQRDAILTATTTEEKLIIELRRLTWEIRRAAMVRAAVVPKGAKGGYMSGPSHSRGGIDIEVEGGEYIFDKKTVNREGLRNIKALHKGRARIAPNRPKFQGGGETGYPKTVKEVVDEFDKAPIWLDEAQDLMIANDKLKTQGPSLAKRIGNVGKKITKIGSKILSKADLVGTPAEVMTSDYIRPGVEGAGGVITGGTRGAGSILKSLLMGTDITKGLAESAVASEQRGRDAGSVNRGQGGFITGSSYGKVLNRNEVVGTGAGTQTSTLSAMAVISEFFLGGGSGASGPTNIKELLAQQAGPSEAVPFKDIKDLNRSLAGMTGPIDGLKRAFLSGEITQKQFTDTLKTHETKVFRRLNASDNSLKLEKRTAVSDRIRSKFDPILTIERKKTADEKQMRAEQKAAEERTAESTKIRMKPVSEGGGGWGLGGEKVRPGGMHLTEKGWRYEGMEEGPIATEESMQKWADEQKKKEKKKSLETDVATGSMFTFAEGKATRASRDRDFMGPTQEMLQSKGLSELSSAETKAVLELQKQEEQERMKQGGAFAFDDAGVARRATAEEMEALRADVYVPYKYDDGTEYRSGMEGRMKGSTTVDGTLVSSEEKLLPAQRKAVEKLKEKEALDAKNEKAAEDWKKHLEDNPLPPLPKDPSDMFGIRAGQSRTQGFGFMGVGVEGDQDPTSPDFDWSFQNRENIYNPKTGKAGFPRPRNTDIPGPLPDRLRPFGDDPVVQRNLWDSSMASMRARGAKFDTMGRADPHELRGTTPWNIDTPAERPLGIPSATGGQDGRLVHPSVGWQGVPSTSDEMSETKFNRLMVQKIAQFRKQEGYEFAELGGDRGPANQRSMSGRGPSARFFSFLGDQEEFKNTVGAGDDVRVRDFFAERNKRAAEMTPAGTTFDDRTAASGRRDLDALAKADASFRYGSNASRDRRPETPQERQIRVLNKKEENRKKRAETARKRKADKAETETANIEYGLTGGMGQGLDMFPYDTSFFTGNLDDEKNQLPFSFAANEQTLGDHTTAPISMKHFDEQFDEYTSPMDYSKRDAKIPGFVGEYGTQPQVPTGLTKHGYSQKQVDANIKRIQRKEEKGQPLGKNLTAMKKDYEKKGYMGGAPPTAPPLPKEGLKQYGTQPGDRDIIAGPSGTNQLKSRKQFFKRQREQQQQGGMEQLRQQQAAGVGGQFVPQTSPLSHDPSEPFKDMSRARAYTPQRRGASGRVSGGEEFRNAGYVARQKRFDRFGIDPRVSRQGSSVRDAMMQQTGYSSAGAARRAGFDPAQLAGQRAQSTFDANEAARQQAFNQGDPRYQQQSLTYGAGPQQQMATTGAAAAPAGAAAPGEAMGQFSANLEELSQKFGTLIDNFGKISLEHTHTFGGEIAIQVNIGNKDKIIQEITTGIQEMVEEEITKHINNKHNDFKANEDGSGG